MAGTAQVPWRRAVQRPSGGGDGDGDDNDDDRDDGKEKQKEKKQDRQSLYTLTPDHPPLRPEY